MHSCLPSPIPACTQYFEFASYYGLPSVSVKAAVHDMMASGAPGYISEPPLTAVLDKLRSMGAFDVAAVERERAKREGGKASKKASKQGAGRKGGKDKGKKKKKGRHKPSDKAGSGSLSSDGGAGRAVDSRLEASGGGHGAHEASTGRRDLLHAHALRALQHRPGEEAGGVVLHDHHPAGRTPGSAPSAQAGKGATARVLAASTATPSSHIPVEPSTSTNLTALVVRPLGRRARISIRGLGVSELQELSTSNVLYYNDHYHPTDIGHRVMGELIAQVRVVGGAAGRCKGARSSRVILQHIPTEVKVQGACRARVAVRL